MKINNLRLNLPMKKRYKITHFKWIRDIKEINSKAVAIMMTGYRQEVDDIVHDAINSSAYTCLCKPLDIAQLLELIENLLKVR